jgi:hypothetical protein
MIKDVISVFFLLLLSVSFSNAQKIDIISSSNSADSSLYDICKLNDNEFWIGGEHGILKSIDSSGIFNSVIYKNKGNSIYKMVKAGKYIYIAADNGTIYKFNIANQQLENLFTSKKYKNYCFYDLIVLENGKLIVCGGKSKIIKTKHILPFGFILEVDTSLLGKMDLLWKSKWNFVWSLTQDNKKIYASAYNGRCSKIIVADKNKRKFKKKYKIKALVHKLIMKQDTLWIAGSKNLHFFKDGIIGKIKNDSININTIYGKGCIWNMLFTGDSILVYANDGTILYNKTDDWVPFKANPHRPIYASIQFNNKSVLMVGNGKTILLLKK